MGVNLGPNDGKVCSFDCLYCEAGFNAQGHGTTGLPSPGQVAKALEDKLSTMKQAGEGLDVITFSGNGEPTVHPHFPEIVDATLALRDKYYPQVKVSVLTNSTMLHDPKTVEALKKIDNAILKLDSAIDTTIKKLDRPVSKGFTAEKVIAELADFGPKAIIQTMITRGTDFDNSTDEEVAALIAAYRKISPREIMLYSLDRPTPDKTLEKIPSEQLQAIAERITRETGIPVQVA